MSARASAVKLALDDVPAGQACDVELQARHEDILWWELNLETQSNSQPPHRFLHRVSYTVLAEPPAIGHAAQPRPICVCAAGRANKNKWAGLTAGISRLAARGDRRWRLLWCSATRRGSFCASSPTPEWRIFRTAMSRHSTLGVWRISCLTLRLSEERRARTAWRCEPLPPHITALCRRLSLRVALPCDRYVAPKMPTWKEPYGSFREPSFVARSFTDIDDLNAQAEAWCVSHAADWRCPEDPERTVRNVFGAERPRLLACRTTQSRCSSMSLCRWVMRAAERGANLRTP